MINWSEELNQEQLEAVVYTEGPLLVLAGAGSGKTRVLTYRVAHMIQERGVGAEHILLLTFTNKAAGEMKERVKRLVNQDIGFAGTFHSFCASILRRYGVMIGLDPDFSIYDEDDRLAAVKMAMKEVSVNDKMVKPGSIVGAISGAKNEMLGVDEYENMARGPFQKAVAEVWRRYELKMKQFAAVDFDDLLVKGVRLLQNPEAKAKLTFKFEQILVDEYQDTNKAQYLLTKLLVDKRGGLTVVGDFSQSIYSWRGADFRNLSYLERDYPNLRTLKLIKNYRSSQTILDAAYGVIGRNNTHPILKLEATNAMGDKVAVYEARDEKDEARFVIDEIEALGEIGQSAVLYRTNAQSRALEESFIRRGIPYVLVGGTKFYERREVKDVLAYLRVIANPLDQVSWERVDKVGKRRRAAFEIWLGEREGSGSKTLPTEELLREVLKVTNYLSLYDEKDEADLMRIENIKELLSVAAEFTDLVAFMENVALVQSEAQSSLDSSGEKVTLMTIHAAKGLEYKNVFIVGMEEGLFPHSRSLMDLGQLEEERRLMYVAMTRAKDKLHLSYAQRRLYFGQRESNIPSRFLSEVPISLLQNRGKKDYEEETTFYDGQRRRIVKPEEVMIDKEKVQKLLDDDFAEIDSW